MEEPREELEPLFDYSRVQPIDFIYLDDGDDLKPFPFRPNGKRKRSSDPELKETPRVHPVPIADKNDEKEKNEEDWLPLPPPSIFKIGSQLQEDKLLKEMRLRKQELAFAQSAEEVLKTVMESAKRELAISAKSGLQSGGSELPRQAERQKIVISVQDKDGQKQFRMYMDDKFEKLFKLYAEKVQLKLESLVFCFDGEKVSPTATPAGLGLENDDMIEVHIKAN